MTAHAPLRTRSRRYIPGRRLLSVGPLAVLTIVLGADFGSVALVRLSAVDDAGEAARAGMVRVQDERSITAQTAENAFRAASQVAQMHSLQIDEQSFLVRSDGTVELKATRTAPTLLLKHLPGIGDLPRTTVSATAARVAW